MRKRDIQRFLETHRKFEFEMDKMNYVVYPKFIIEAMLKDKKD